MKRKTHTARKVEKHHKNALKAHTARKVEKHRRKPEKPVLKQARVLKWASPEYQTHKKGKIWHILIGLFTAGIIAYGIYDRAWTFVIALAVSIIIYYQFLYRSKPKSLEIVLSDSGIKIGKHEYLYSQIRYFWIIEKEEIRALNIRLKRQFIPDITIFLEEQNAQSVRNFLKEKIQEIEKNEGLSDTLVRLFKI